MAAYSTPRIGIYRWELDSDEFTRVQMDDSHENIEARVGGFYIGSVNPVAAPQYERSLFYNSANQQLYFFNGVDASGSWISLNDFIDASRNIDIKNGIATTINKVAITAPATGATLTIKDGKTAVFDNSVTFSSNDGATVSFGAGGTVTYTSNKLSVFTATTSAELAGVISDETGTGSLVFANTPTLVTPNIGAANAISVNKVAITAPTNGATLTILDGKTAQFSNTLTLTGTDSSTVNFGAGGTVAYIANKLNVFAATTSSELAGVISDETGTGSLVFANTPTLVTPNIGSATATSVNNVAFTAPAALATISLAAGSTLATSGAFSITLTSTGATTVTLPTSGTLATLAGTETLSNKALSDTTVTFANAGDATKRVRFDVAGVATGTTRVLTVPNVNGTIITSGDTGTVTNTMISAVDQSKVTGLQAWADGRYYTETEINNAYVYQWGNRPTGAGGALTNARQIYVQTDIPASAQDGDLWFDL